MAAERSLLNGRGRVTLAHTHSFSLHDINFMMLLGNWELVNGKCNEEQLSPFLKTMNAIVKHILDLDLNRPE